MCPDLEPVVDCVFPKLCKPAALDEGQRSRLIKPPARDWLLLQWSPLGVLVELLGYVSSRKIVVRGCFWCLGVFRVQSLMCFLFATWCWRVKIEKSTFVSVVLFHAVTAYVNMNYCVNRQQVNTTGWKGCAENLYCVKQDGFLNNILSLMSEQWNDWSNWVICTLWGLNMMLFRICHFEQHGFIRIMFTLPPWLCSFPSFITLLFSNLLFASFNLVRLPRSEFLRIWSDCLITSFGQTEQEGILHLKEKAALEATKKGKQEWNDCRWNEPSFKCSYNS